MTNKSNKCRPPPPSCLLINSPPSDNKSPTWSNRFLHKLTVVAHPARLQQLHFQPDFLKTSSALIFNKSPSSSQLGRRTNANPPPFVSNSVRHFAVFVVQLHLCSSIPDTPSLGGSTPEAPPGRQARWHRQLRKRFRYFWPRTGNAYRAAVRIIPQGAELQNIQQREISINIFSWILCFVCFYLVWLVSLENKYPSNLSFRWKIYLMGLLFWNVI